MAAANRVVLHPFISVTILLLKLVQVNGDGCDILLIDVILNGFVVRGICTNIADIHLLIFQHVAEEILTGHENMCMRGIVKNLNVIVRQDIRVGTIFLAILVPFGEKDKRVVRMKVFSFVAIYIGGHIGRSEHYCPRQNIQ